MSNLGVRGCLRLPAYAKLNLSLLVGPKRADGYHEISTVMVKISLCDWLEFSPAPAGVLELSCSEPSLPLGHGNTVFKAASLLMERYSPQLGARIHLEKGIPWGAGLGGGSSDAAVTFRALNRLWNLRLSEEDLMRLGAEVGSDVPFFFSSSAAIATGRGEVLEPFEHGLGGYPLVVYPGVSVSTAWAYGAVTPRLTLDGAITNIAALSCKRGDMSALANVACNDFEPVVFNNHPLLREVVEGLRAKGAVFAGMSGSGSSLFGIFNREDERNEAYLWAQQRGFSVWAVEWVSDGV